MSKIWNAYLYCGLLFLLFCFIILNSSFQISQSSNAESQYLSQNTKKSYFLETFTNEQYEIDKRFSIITTYRKKSSLKESVDYLGLGNRYLERLASQSFENCRDWKVFNGPGKHSRVCCDSTNITTGQSYSSMRCIPNIIVAGTQKAGTTILHSILMMHPQLSYPSKLKEIHYFDLGDKLKPLDGYVSEWPAVFDTATPQLNFESTPSYLPNVRSCRRMATNLPPWTKIIVMVRDPVRRVWSEINMFKRLKRHKLDRARVLFKDMDQFRDCTKHPTRDEVFTCIKLYFSFHADLNFSIEVADIHRVRKRCFDEAALETHERVQCLIDEKFLNNTPYPYEDNILAEIKHLESNCIDNANSIEATQMASSDAKCTHTEAKEMRCNTNLFTESFNILVDEMEQLFCNEPNCRCVSPLENMSSLRRNWVWRSMYYSQLKNCFRYIPRQNIIVVDSESLKSDAEATIQEILEALHLEYIPVDMSEAKKKFDEQYPKFESITGWRMHGSDLEEMPEELKRRLYEYFEPWNEKFFQLVGRKFPHWKQPKK